jgi:WD40 repeat protein
VAAEQHAPEDMPLRLLKRHFVKMEHLLTRCITLNDVTSVLTSRLQHLPELTDLCQKSFAERLPPFVALWYALPDLPHFALIRTLQGHMHGVYGCAVSLDGTLVVSASRDKSLKVWNAASGAERLILQGHAAAVIGCAVSPGGTFIVSASDDTTLKVWDAHTGICLITFPVEGVLLACGFHPDGKHLVAAGAGGIYFLEWVP